MARNIAAPLIRTERLLDLVPFLHAHQGISVADLAQQFDVTKQQILSDLTTLWMCGLPGYTPLELMELDFDSGYVTIRNAATLSKPRLVTFDEALALLLGLDLVINSLPSDRQDLSDIARELSTRISTKVGLKTVLQAEPLHSPETVATINKALNTRSGLKITYHSLYRDIVSEREVIPHNLYEANSHLYLKAFCNLARDFREFRVDRIMAISPAQLSMNSQYIAPEDVSLEFSIELLIPNRDFLERFGVDEVSKSAKYVLSSFSQQWIERSILASGESVVLTSPGTLRKQVASSAKVMLDRYKSEANSLTQ